jgi:hypothetical protein
MKFECFLQIGKSLFFRFTLAGDINLQALRDIPVPLAPDSCGEWSLHDHILSHDDRRRIRAAFNPGQVILCVVTLQWSGRILIGTLALDSTFVRTDDRRGDR